MTVIDTIRDVLDKEFHIPPEKLTPETDLQSLGVDSLAVLELAFVLEDRLNVSLDPAEFKGTKLGDLVEAIERQVAAKAAQDAAAPPAGTGN